MIAMKHIIDKWLLLQSDIQEFKNPKSIYHNNVIEAIGRTRLLGKHIQQNLDEIQQWLSSYLNNNRAEIYLRYWLETGNEYLLHYLDNKQDHHHIHSRIHEWASFFDDSTFLTYDISFANAKEIVKNAVNRMDPNLCNDPLILDIHKGRDCVSNGWFCDYCEDLEHSWKNKLVEQAKQTNNVFLNKSLHDEFVNSVLNSPIVSLIPNTWTFPKIYNGLYSFSEKPLETMEDMIQKARETRNVYEKQGQTPFQACTDFISTVFSYSSGFSIQQSQMTKEWKIFRYFMNKMDVVLYVLPIDLAQCREIEDMF